MLQMATWLDVRNASAMLQPMTDETFTLTITGDDAERLARLVQSGQYASPEAAVADALAELEGGVESEIDGWLKSTVATRYDAFKADPSRGVSLEQARRRLLGPDHA